MSEEKCAGCGGAIFMVEYSLTDPFHYDGVSEYACQNALKDPPTCRNRVGRFCGKHLGPKEHEPPHCEGMHPLTTGLLKRP